jgi:hypothetical protein
LRASPTTDSFLLQQDESSEKHPRSLLQSLLSLVFLPYDIPETLIDRVFGYEVVDVHRLGHGADTMGAILSLKKRTEKTKGKN